MTLEEQKTEQFDEELSEELEMAEFRSERDTVNCTVRKVEKIDDKNARITFSTPRNKKFSRKSKIPRSPDEDVLLNRILKDSGFTLATADELIGYQVPFQIEKDGDYKCCANPVNDSVIPNFLISSAESVTLTLPDKAGPDRFSRSFSIVSALFGLPFVSFISYLILLAGDEVDKDDVIVPFLGSLVATTIWSIIIASVIIVV